MAYIIEDVLVAENPCSGFNYFKKNTNTNRK